MVGHWFSECVVSGGNEWRQILKPQVDSFEVWIAEPSCIDRLSWWKNSAADYVGWVFNCYEWDVILAA